MSAQSVATAPDTPSPTSRARPLVPLARRLVRLAIAYVAFFALLFATRFLARGHLIPRLDQECHIGGIALDLLAHGVRFPLLAYAPNEYDNGSFYSGVLAAGAFGLLGRNVLALKLITHAFTAAGAVAMITLLRGCLDELGVSRRRDRYCAVAALVIGVAFAPRLVTLASMYAVGTHTEGAAINAVLLALFSTRQHTRTWARTAAFWALVGVSLYLNKATFLVLVVMGLAEIALALGVYRTARPADRRDPDTYGLSSSNRVDTARRWSAALAGLVLGLLPEIVIVARRHGMGWLTISGKASRNVHGFPRAFLGSLSGLVEGRAETALAFVLALLLGVVLVTKARTWTVSLVAGVSVVHLAAMVVMAQGGFDRYAIYGHASFVVLVAVGVGLAGARASMRWGDRAGLASLVAGLAVVLVVDRPDVLTPSAAKLADLARDSAGAACSWRFAEGFAREVRHGLTPAGTSAEQHVIDRCRSLVEPGQVLDCIGGMARELTWRHQGRVEGGEPPAALNDRERLAYAFNYGFHRRGDTSSCMDFDAPELQKSCQSAVRLDCLGFSDLYTGAMTGKNLARPICEVDAPPMDGFWASMHRDLFARPVASGARVTQDQSIEEIGACGSFLASCYP